jgi:uncharacterized integral membrane protein
MKKVAIQQIVDWSRVDLGAHYVLLVDGAVIARAVRGVTLADLRREYKRIRAE